MPDRASRIVVEAHALRSATAKAALLHGSRRTPRELRRPYASIIGSIVVGLLLLVMVWAATKIGDLVEKQREQRARRSAAAVTQLVQPPRNVHVGVDGSGGPVLVYARLRAHS